MARVKRYQLANVAYLVSQRGHNRLPCFYDGEDYLTFVEALKRLTTQHQCALHAWTMIPDGYWVLLTPSTGSGLALVMQTLGRLYVRYINRKYGRAGTLWSCRYRACVVEPDSKAFTLALRYIETVAHRNLVVSEEDHWPWQSTPAREITALDWGDHVDNLDSALNSGLVFGSPDFLRRVEKATAIRTLPLKRGRPPAPIRVKAT